MPDAKTQIHEEIVTSEVMSPLELIEALTEITGIFNGRRLSLATTKVMLPVLDGLVFALEHATQQEIERRGIAGTPEADDLLKSFQNFRLRNNPKKEEAVN